MSELVISRTETVEARSVAVQAEAARAQLHAELDASRAHFQASLQQAEANIVEAEAARSQLQAELGASRGQLQAVTAQFEAARQDMEATRLSAAQSAAALAAAERRAAGLEAEVERLRAAAVRDPLPPDFSCGKTLELSHLLTACDLRCFSFVAGWRRRSRGGCSGI